MALFKNLLEKDFIKTIEQKASQVIKKERLRYKSIYKLVETYCQNNKLIISNLDFLLNNSEIIDPNYEIYSETPLRDARNLAIFIYNEDKNEMIRMKTKVANQHLSIEYDGREFIHIHRLHNLRNISLTKVINPVKFVSQYEKNLLLMSSEIELIHIYHTLYNLEYVDDWEKNLDLEQKLLVKLNLRKTEGKLGGIRCMNFRGIEPLKQAIMKDLLPYSEYVLIGTRAIDLVNSKLQEDPEKLQIISPNKIENDINKLATILNKYTKLSISFREQNLRIPQDNRLKKYTIYLKSGGFKSKERAIIDIYNATSYELVPFVMSQRFPHCKLRNVKIANRFVVCRFLLVDLWVIRLIGAMGSLPESILVNKINKVFGYFEKIQNKNKTYRNKIFGICYAGQYVDSNISGKLEAKKTGLYYPFYPSKEK